MESVRIDVSDPGLRLQVESMLSPWISADGQTPVLLVSDQDHRTPLLSGIPGILIAVESSLPSGTSEWDEVLPVTWLPLLAERVARYLTGKHLAGIGGNQRADVHPGGEEGAAPPDLTFRLSIYPRVHFTHVSSSIRDLFGYSARAFVDDRRLLFRLMEQEDRLLFLSGLRKRQFFDRPFAFRASDNRMRPLQLEAFLTPHLRENGRVEWIDCVLRCLSSSQSSGYRMQEEAGRLRSVLESIDQGLMITDASGHSVFCNRAMQAMTGYSLQDLSGDGLPERLFIGSTPPDGGPPSAPEGPARLKQIRCLTGEIRTVAVASSRIRAPGPPLILSVFTDVTRDEETAELLRSQWNQLQLMLRHLPIILWELDDRGRLTYLEGSLLERIGIAPHRYLGRKVARLFARDPEWAGFRERIYAGQSEVVLKRLRGITVRIFARPAFDEKGSVTGMTGLCTDISDLLLALDVIRRQKGFFESLFNQLPVGVYILDPLKGFAGTMVNRKGAELLGIDAARPEANTYPLQDDTDRLDELLRARGGMVRFERIVQQGDRRQQLKIVLVPVSTGDESPIVLGIVEDVNEQKAYEEQIMRAREDAESANVYKSRIMAQMGHEIRTPLNAIIGFAEILLSRLGPEWQYRDYVEGIQSSGQRLVLLVNDILDFSRIEAGGLEIRTEIVEPARILDDVQTMFGMMARERRVRISVRVDEQVPRYVSLDQTRFRQILVALVGNAVKFTSDGDVSIEMAAGPIDGERFPLTVSVHDTGIGISPGQLERIFEPFHIGSHESVEGGTGLGLAIASRLARMMDGSIDAQSTPGMGSTFCLHLAGVRVAQPAGDAVAARDSSGRLSLRFAGSRVLIVEDDPISRQVLVEFLDGMGLDLAQAGDGAEALAAVERERPDLVLMDIQMPIMDGYEVARRIRDREDGASLPIVALTGDASPEDSGQRMMNGYLRKPFSRDDLLGVLRNILPCEVSGGGETESAGEDVLPIALDLDHLDDLPDLLQRLEGLRSSLNLNDIRRLEVDLRAVGAKRGSSAVRDLADRLAVALDTVSVARMIQFLDQLLAKMRHHVKDVPGSEREDAS